MIDHLSITGSKDPDDYYMCLQFTPGSWTAERPATAATPRHAMLGAWESMHTLLSPHSFAIVDHGAVHPPNQVAASRLVCEGSAPHPASTSPPHPVCVLGVILSVLLVVPASTTRILPDNNSGDMNVLAEIHMNGQDSAQARAG